MIKKNKSKLIMSSILIILPMFLSFFFFFFLPDKVIAHLNINGAADAYLNSKIFFIVISLILLAFHWLCFILYSYLNKNNEQNNKITEMIYWIIPVISLSVNSIVFATTLGFTSKVFAFVLILIGLSFIIVGNYMPKTTRNAFIGIKIKWALMNDENWNATHRFAGKVWVIVGFLCFFGILLPESALPFIMIAIILVSISLPVIYSYLFYKKQLADGDENIDDSDKVYKSISVDKKKAKIIVSVFLGIIAFIVCVLMFTGSVKTTLNDNGIFVEATLWSDLELDYDVIDSVEYRENGVDGQRITGVGSAKLLLGNFKNAEFGFYTRYTFNNDTPCIVIRANDKIYVINAEDEQTVKAMYDIIKSKISK